MVHVPTIGQEGVPPEPEPEPEPTTTSLKGTPAAPAEDGHCSLVEDGSEPAASTPMALLPLGSDEFPDEVLAVVCCFLGLRELGRLACVSRRFTERTLTEPACESKAGAGGDGGRTRLSPIEEGARLQLAAAAAAIGDSMVKRYGQTSWLRTLWFVESQFYFDSSRIGTHMLALRDEGRVVFADKPVSSLHLKGAASSVLLAPALRVSRMPAARRCRFRVDTFTAQRRYLMIGLCDPSFDLSREPYKSPNAQGKPNAAFCVTRGSNCGSFGGDYSGSLSWLKQGQVLDVTVDPSTRQVRFDCGHQSGALSLPPGTDEFYFFVSFLQYGAGNRHDGVVSIVPSQTAVAGPEQDLTTD